MFGFREGGPKLSDGQALRLGQRVERLHVSKSVGGLEGE